MVLDTYAGPVGTKQVTTKFNKQFYSLIRPKPSEVSEIVFQPEVSGDAG